MSTIKDFILESFIFGTMVYMTLHPIKRISSIEGLGINTTKTIVRLSDTVSIGTEVWNELDEAWREGDTIIAQPGYIWTTKWELGKPYIITKFQDENGKLIAVYCDVARPVKKINNGFEFEDLYLDIWQIPEQRPVVLDRDELTEAVIAGYITRDESCEAERVADTLISALNNNPDFLAF